MALAASWTTNALSVTDTCRLNFCLRLLTASTIDSVNARSLTALGATIATFKVFVPAPPEDGAEVVVVVDLELELLQAAATRATPTQRTAIQRMVDLMVDMIESPRSLVGIEEVGISRASQE